MIYKKECPKGIDIWIQKLQCDLYSYLIDETVWDLKEKDYNCYGRAYRNRRDKGYVPEVFTGGKEYKELLLNDKVAVHSFFGIAQNANTDQAKAFTDDIHLVFFVNLDKIRGGKNREDEEARNDVHMILRQELYGFEVKGMVTGVERVLDEYAIKSEADLVKFDMHPWHCFRFNLTNTYNPTTE